MELGDGCLHAVGRGRVSRKQSYQDKQNVTKFRSEVQFMGTTVGVSFTSREEFDASPAEGAIVTLEGDLSLAFGGDYRVTNATLTPVKPAAQGSAGRPAA
jgi:hypothetical protein